MSFVSGCAAAIFLLLTFVPVSGTTLKGDEEMILFPTAAFLDPEAGKWNIPVHGWVFEPEEKSVWRSALVEELLGWIELRSDSVNSEIFRNRARMFLVDNERGKRFTIKVAGASLEAQPSGPNGHFRQVIELEENSVAGIPPGTWLPARIDPAQTGERRPAGRAQLVPPVGVSVVSDIDDTIKASNVLDKRELLENTFLREFKVIPGMSEVYRKWAAEGVVFHYVSGSPWQLFPALNEFMSKEGFPEGSFSLRTFRVKDRTFFNLLSSPEKSKVPAIESIFARYPDRKFILVGDSGEKDPEVYGEIARRHPVQVMSIFIRNVPGSDDTPGRYGAAFNGLGKDLWTVFNDPEELKAIVEVGEQGKAVPSERNGEPEKRGTGEKD